MEKYIYEISPGDFQVVSCDTGKENLPYKNYFNLGYFAQGDGVTIPVGNLATDGNIIAHAKTNASWLNTSGHKLTTIYTTKDGKCGITKTDDLTTISGLQAAVSGVPITVSGRKITMDEIKAEGYFGSELYDTWHGFLGIKDSKLVYVGMRCGFNDMYDTLKSLGINDAIKVDGGGSYVLKTPDVTVVTKGNRKINNIGVFTPVKKESSEKMLNILLIAGHGEGDPGAPGIGCNEADLTREFVKLLKPELDKYANVDVADTSKNWYEHRYEIDARSYDYVLENHFNAIKKETVSDGKNKGTEIYVTHAEKGTGVEEKIVGKISALGFKNRGVKKNDYSLIKRIKNQGVSSALLEICFIDDIDDMKIYNAKKKEIAVAVAEGIAEGFGLKKTEIAAKEEVKDEKENCLTDIKGHWAEKHIQKLVDYGVVNGYPDGTFKPDNTITRAEAAAMISNALTVCGK